MILHESANSRAQFSLIDLTSAALNL